MHADHNHTVNHHDEHDHQYDDNRPNNDHHSTRHHYCKLFYDHDIDRPADEFVIRAPFDGCTDDDCTRDHVHVFTNDELAARDHTIYRSAIDGSAPTGRPVPPPKPRAAARGRIRDPRPVARSARNDAVVNDAVRPDQPADNTDRTRFLASGHGPARDA